jgi:preprotein translocase subunit SecD
MDAETMNPQAGLTALLTALLLTLATLPAIAAPKSADARAVDKARAAVAANAQKQLEQQGGALIVLKVDADALRDVMMTELHDDVFKTLHDERIPFTGLAARDGGVEVRVADARNQQRLLSKLVPPSEVPPSRAAEVGGDGLMKLMPTDSGFAARLQGLVRQSIELIEQALRNNGIAEAGIEADATDRIRILLPGIADPDHLAALLGKKAKVAFRMVDVSMTPAEAVKGPPPASSEIVYDKNKEPYLLLKQIEIEGDDIIDASPGFAPGTDQPIASFRFNAHGTRRFAHLTADNIGRPFAIVINDQVMSAPIIREPILTGTGQISGNFTLEQANSIAMLLRSGTLPGHLGVVEQQIVKPRSSAGKQ